MVLVSRKQLIAVSKDKLGLIVPIVLIVLLGLLIVNIDRIFPTPSTGAKVDQIIRDADYNAGEGGTNPNASVTVVEFSDFQCPACSMAAPEVRKVLNYYGGKINFIYKHFPVKEGSNLAAQAAECARDQDMFWEYHDLLFENLHKVTASYLQSYAEQLGLDMDEFSTCISSGAKKSKVSLDFTEGYRLGIKGTPTFLVNDKMLTGARSFAEFRQIIDEELK